MEVRLSNYFFEVCHHTWSGVVPGRSLDPPLHFWFQKSIRTVLWILWLDPTTHSTQLHALSCQSFTEAWAKSRWNGKQKICLLTTLTSYKISQYWGCTWKYRYQEHPKSFFAGAKLDKCKHAQPKPFRNLLIVYWCLERRVDVDR